MATLNLNGRDVSLPDDPRTTLLAFLHQHLSLFGTKKGCDHGQCGACTVIADGKRINACLVFAFQLEGAEPTQEVIQQAAEAELSEAKTFGIKNLPVVHPMTSTRFTTHNLGECLRQGAQNFKWLHKVQSAPRKQIGHGVAK